MFQVGVVVGLLISYLVGSFIDYKDLALVSAILAGAGTVATFLIPESPAWLLAKGRVKEAVRAMKRLRMQGAGYKDVTEVIKDTKREMDAEAAKSGGSAGDPAFSASRSRSRALACLWLLCVPFARCVCCFGVCEPFLPV
jgi:hypothetical protein